jgi:hypothetical protein
MQELPAEKDGGRGAGMDYYGDGPPHDAISHSISSFKTGLLKFESLAR